MASYTLIVWSSRSTDLSVSRPNCTCWWSIIGYIWLIFLIKIGASVFENWTKMLSNALSSNVKESDLDLLQHFTYLQNSTTILLTKRQRDKETNKYMRKYTHHRVEQGLLGKWEAGVQARKWRTNSGVTSSWQVRNSGCKLTGDAWSYEVYLFFKF